MNTYYTFLYNIIVLYNTFYISKLYNTVKFFIFLSFRKYIIFNK